MIQRVTYPWILGALMLAAWIGWADLGSHLGDK